MVLWKACPCTVHVLTIHTSWHCAHQFCKMLCTTHIRVLTTACYSTHRSSVHSMVLHTSLFSPQHGTAHIIVLSATWCCTSHISVCTMLQHTSRKSKTTCSEALRTTSCSSDYIGSIWLCAWKYECNYIFSLCSHPRLLDNFNVFEVDLRNTLRAASRLNRSRLQSAAVTILFP